MVDRSDRTTVEVNSDQKDRLDDAKRKMSYELGKDLTLGQTIDQLARRYLSDDESESETAEEADR